MYRKTFRAGSNVILVSYRRKHVTRTTQRVGPYSVLSSSESMLSLSVYTTQSTVHFARIVMNLPTLILDRNINSV